MCVEENFCFEITIFLDFAGVFAKSKMPLKTNTEEQATLMFEDVLR